MWSFALILSLVYAIIFFLPFNYIFPAIFVISLTVFLVKKTISLILFAFFTSIVLVFILAFIDLNIIAVKPYGIFTDIDQINTHLLKYKLAPKIIAIDKKAKLATYEIAKQSAGTNNLFGKHILSFIPPEFILSPQNVQPDFILIDDKLIISRISPDQIKTLSPTLGYLFVQNYFTQLSIKSFPKVELLSDEDYKKYRRDDFLDKLKLVDIYQQATKDSIATYSANLTSRQLQIIGLQSQIAKIYADLNSGAKDRDTKYNQVSEINNQLDTLKSDLTDIQVKIADAATLSAFFSAQTQLGEKLINNIPSERGVFYPPDQIKLSLPDSNPHTVADYLVNLIHEYLHYASYVDNDHKLNNPFFEEGLTEFYARQIIDRHLNIQTNLGYPVLNIIFTKLTKNLPDSDLLEIYFTKNEPALIRIVNQVYGQNFYQDNANLLLAIQSTNDRAKLLPLANLLMSKIKGPQLTEDDLKSTVSTY